MSKTLHYDFVTDKSLAAKVGPTLGITRTTDATYFDSAGVMQTAGSGVARFDHNPTTNASLGLLVEEARTNICLQSEDFSTTWTGDTDTLAIVGNEATAPDGADTADMIVDNSSTGTGNNVRTIQAFTALPQSQPLTVSCYMKADGSDWSGILVASIGALAINATYDLTNGVVGAIVGADVDSTGIEDARNGWYRCWLSWSNPADATGQLQTAVCSSDGNFIVDLDGTSSIFVWGAQLEAGAFPTSYIPTVAASVTRNADVVSSTDLSWYSESAGSIYTKSKIPQPIIGAQVLECFSPGGSDRNIIGTDFTGNGSYRASYSVAAIGTQYQLDSLQTLPDTDFIKCAVGWSTNDAAFYTEGTLAATDSSVTPAATDAVTSFSVGSNFGGGGQPSGHIAEIRCYNERLTNEQLEDMSNGIFPTFGNPYGPGLGFGKMGAMGLRS